MVHYSQKQFTAARKRACIFSAQPLGIEISGTKYTANDSRSKTCPVQIFVAVKIDKVLNTSRIPLRTSDCNIIQMLEFCGNKLKQCTLNYAADVQRILARSGEVVRNQNVFLKAFEEKTLILSRTWLAY